MEGCLHCVEGRLLRWDPSDSGAKSTSLRSLVLIEMSFSCAEWRPRVPFWRLRVVRHAPAPSVHRGAFTLWAPRERTCPNGPLKYASWPAESAPFQSPVGLMQFWAKTPGVLAYKSERYKIRFLCLLAYRPTVFGDLTLTLAGTGGGGGWCNPPAVFQEYILC